MKLYIVFLLLDFQSDILHQSAYELIHSEDRDEFKRHLQWNEKLTNEHQNLSIEQILTNPGRFFYIYSNKKKANEMNSSRTRSFIAKDIYRSFSMFIG